jgi:hypothetical protein
MGELARTIGASLLRVTSPTLSLPRRRGRGILAEIVGQPIIPESLRSDAGAGVGAARAWHDEDAAPSENGLLRTELDRRTRADDRAPAGDALEAGDARREPLQLLRERGDAADELVEGDVARLRRCALDDVGEAEAEAEKGAVVLRQQAFDAERGARFGRKRRLREGRPEPVRAAREIVPTLGRVAARVDPDEDDRKPLPQKVGKRLFRQWRRASQASPPRREGAAAAR